MNLELNGIATLTHLGVIRAYGPDAVNFLQGQLSNDVALQKPTEARLAAFCSAKGRMQASMVVVKLADDDLLLVCSADLLAATLKRLSMFVMRSKLKLTDASADWTLLGLAGDAIEKIAGGAHSAWAVSSFFLQPAKVSALSDDAHLTALELPMSAPPTDALPTDAVPTKPLRSVVVGLYPAVNAAEDRVVQRALLLCPSTQPFRSADGHALSADELTRLPTQVWAWSEVMSGVATLTAPLVDAFVPQMLNFESVGGVSFKKGCYPGQEIVARSQFRGSIKRRACILQCAIPMATGDAVFLATEPEQPCGLIVQAAMAPPLAHAAAETPATWNAIASLQVSATTTDSSQGKGQPNGMLRLHSADGPVLTLLPLPYALLEDI